MKDQQNDVWVGLEDRTNDPSLKERASKEFYELPIVDSLADKDFVEKSTPSRRDFLKYLGFGVGAATLAASCEIPIKKAIPYIVKPDSIVPGVASYYASSFVNGGDYCAVLVKTREGRPIKIEGNPSSKITKGGTSARAQASVLSLYNTSRIQGPAKIADSKIADSISWADLDKEVMSKLASASSIRIITGTELSHTTKKTIAELTAKYPNTKVVTYDANSAAGILLANEASFGQKAIPSYSFDKAELVVSFDADFLGSWVSPVEYAADWATTRRIDDVKKAKMSRLVVVENGMSLTGSNADNRILVKPSEQGAAIVTLYNEVARLTGGESVSAKKVNDKASRALKALAKDLTKNAGKSIVVAGANDKNAQVVVNKINDLLGNYGKTMDFAEASLQRQGVEKDMQQLVRELASTDVAIVMNCNPAYDLPNAEQFSAAFAKVKTKISLSYLVNETTALCDYAAPVNHYLESWSDAQPKRGHYSLIQPTIQNLYNTRQAGHSFLTWAGSSSLDTQAEQPYHDYLRKTWKSDMFPQQSSFASFDAFWDNCLYEGVLHIPQAAVATSFAANVAGAASKIKNSKTSGIEVNLYETVNLGDGSYADNPWLQEMPDPVMRTTWGNYLSVGISYDAANNSYKTFQDLTTSSKGYTDKAKIASGDKGGVLPVVNQFGQMPDTCSAGLGYGRTVISSVGQNTGVNLYSLCSINEDGLTQYWTEISVEKAGREDEFACVQYHHTMGITGNDSKGEKINVDEEVEAYQGSLTTRTIIRSTNVENLDTFVDDLVHERQHHQKLNSYTLYPGHDSAFKMGHHWAMHVDLNSCTGCGACTVACMAENNVPVVGKKEVHRHHEMTWLRIDRYYYGDANNPNTVYQPMMCQHCDNAPCENVCPVAATNHSSEGLNQMTYNRCIGTRYCANNCPYKVRRFNWFDYTTADLWPANEYSINGEDVPFGADNLTRMVLNPDVTVRSRGVIEKCSFCVQRIQEGKLLAKREMRGLKDNDVKTACQTACPTGAIVFGDRNDKDGWVSKRMESPLNYLVLEEVNLASSVFYSAKVNNRDEKLDA